MTLATAQAAAAELRTSLLDNGVRAVSIELQQGVAGSGWGVEPFKRGLGHHIVSRPPGTPGLALVKKGRPDLGGPLCLEYGCAVLTRRGILPVQDIKIGDEVWTHLNRWRPVTAVMQRTAPTVHLRAPGVSLVCSADHPWLSEQGEWTAADEASTLVHAGAIDTGMPVPDVDGFTATAELLRVAGAWVADGYIAKHKRKNGFKPYACFTIRSAKTEMVGKWLTAAGLDWWQTQDRGQSVVLMVRSVALADWLVEHFGEYSYGKTIPAWLLGNQEHAHAFIEGYLHGDGTEVPANAKHLPYRRSQTVSRGLASGLVLAARSLGMHAYIAQRRAAREELQIAGKQTRGREYWVVDIYEPGERRLLKYRPAEQGLAVDITDTTPESEQTVYDITVAEDHSMLVDGVWSHNCNGYGGFDLVARIITMGRANHPGTGGPWSVPGWGTVPVNNGRPYIFGWEFEGGIVAWTDAMHDFMARCGAGTLDWLGTLPGNPGPAPLECWGEHLTWAPGRKIDRLGYTTASGRQRIAAVRDTTGRDWFDMATPQELEAIVLKVVRGEGLSGAGDAPLMLKRGYEKAIRDEVTAVLRSEGVSGAGDVSRIVAAIRAELPAEGSAGYSLADVEAATERAVRKVAADASA